jgi:PAS domain S-box-containing protein
MLPRGSGVDIDSRHGDPDDDAPRRVQATQLLAAIVESSDDAIISKSRDGIIQTWNAAAERIFGFTAAQAVGHHISIIIPADRLAEEQTIMSKLLAGERIEHFETIRQRSDGRKIVVSLTISPVKDEAGRIVAASKIARDISARLQAAERERALLAEAAATNAKFRALFEQATLFAGILDLQGTVVEANRLSWEGCGYSRDQVIGMRFWEGPWWAPSSDISSRVRHATEQALLGQSARAELPYFLASGEQRMVDVFIQPIRDEAGNVVLLAPSGIDITDRKRAEEAQRETEARLRALADNMSRLTVELENVNRRKDEFLATLSHELRTPLAAIRNAQAVLNGAHRDPAIAERALGTMNRQIAQMTRLLDDLLDVSRITHDSLQLRLARVELATVLNHALEACRPLYEHSGLSLRVEMPDAPVYVLADAARLAQVFGNLLTNAAKYTPPNGHVSVTTEREGDQVAVVVTDTGVGIPPDMLSRVFELFTQVDGQFERAQGGLGIGLSLVKRLVEMHGGTVTAHSDGRGTGSRFVVRLPVLPGVAVERKTPDSTMNDTTVSRHVLVVDDEPDSAVTLAMLLQLRGHRADVAQDGAEALDRAETLRPDVILLDLGLPGMDGYEVCRRLREQPWARTMFIVALTGWGQEEDRRRTREAGFDLHLVKPVDPDELMRVLASRSS